VVIVGLLYIFYEAASIGLFIYVNNVLSPDSDTIKKWKNNYTDGGCGELDMTYALQNACLNGCGYMTLPVFMYIALYQRNKFSLHFTVHDS
jgi:hypothetical protein